MKNIVIVIVFSVFGFFTQMVNAGQGISCKSGICVNNDTRELYGFTFTPSYKNTYAITVLDISDSCDDTVNITKTVLPKNSHFRRTLDGNAQNAKEMVVHVYKVQEFDDDDPNTTGVQSTEKKYFSTPFKVCINGKNVAYKSNYKRIGGVSTGVLVVPFKIRKGSIFSDSTIAPYLSYKWEVIELLVAAGVSQISVSKLGESGVKTETGLSMAVGVNFEIAKDWDVAFVIGADHISGADQAWKYQDKAWYSFAIGYNFTR